MRSKDAYILQLDLSAFSRGAHSSELADKKPNLQTLIDFYMNSSAGWIVWFFFIVLLVITFGMVGSFGLWHTASIAWYIAALSVMITTLFLSWWFSEYRRDQHLLRQIALDNNWLAETDIRPSKRGIKGVYESYTASIFSLGHSRSIRLLLRQNSPPGIVIGEYQYQVGLTWGYGKRVSFIKIPLERRIPHLMLKSRSGVALERVFDNNQRQNLEGNFPDYFTLYCPRKYESDARFILTPDFMYTLMIHAAGSHVEIIDRDMYIYGEQINPVSRQGLATAITIVNGLSRQALRRTERYYDDRRRDLRDLDQILVQGKRLKFVRTDILIGIILFLLYVLFRLISHLI